MDRKDRAEISKNSKKGAYKHVVSEGSVVVLDARDIIGDEDTSSIKSYSWKPVTDIHLDINDVAKDKSIISFTAPYVKDNDPNMSLGFELAIADKDGKIRHSPYNANVIVKRIQRAMIFQGGVALGAYEAG